MPKFHESLNVHIPKAHPARKLIKEKNYSVPATASFIGHKTNYTYQILSGAIQPSPRAEVKLQELIRLLKGGAS